MEKDPTSRFIASLTSVQPKQDFQTMILQDYTHRCERIRNQPNGATLVTSNRIFGLVAVLVLRSRKGTNTYTPAKILLCNIEHCSSREEGGGVRAVIERKQLRSLEPEVVGHPVLSSYTSQLLIFAFNLTYTTFCAEDILR